MVILSIILMIAGRAGGIKPDTTQLFGHEDAYNNGKRASVGSAFLHAFYGFLRAYIIQLGFLDGWSGLYSSAFHAGYILLKYCKLYELQTKK